MKNLRFVFILSIMYVSCQKVELSIPDTGRKLVINGLISTDSLLNVNISESLYIFDSLLVDETLLKNARILVYENSQFVDSLQFRDNVYVNLGADCQIQSNYQSYKLFPVAGHEYEIVAELSGWTEAKAKTHIPEVVKIDKIDTSVVKLPGTFDFYESNIRLFCNIEFTDPGDKKNYYLLYVYKVPNRWNNIEFCCQDNIVEEELNHGSMKFGVAFSDKSTNGQKYNLRIILNGRDIGMPFYDDSRQEIVPTHKKIIYFRLYSITEEYFKYIQTLNLFYKNYKNPLADPTQVYSNIEGGYGIFAGAAVSSDSLVFTY